VINFHRRFAWYELITTEAEAAKEFYSKVMGWGVLDASLPDRAYTLFAAGNDLVSGLMDWPEEGQRTGGKPAWIGYIGVDDVDATAGRIRDLGGTVHVPPTDVINVSRFSIFADPQTARLGLLRWARSPLQKPADLGTIGQVGWHELLASDWQKAFAFYSELFGWQSTDADIGEMGTYHRTTQMRFLMAINIDISLSSKEPTCRLSLRPVRGRGRDIQPRSSWTVTSPKRKP
jgi:predicted enzyme related to lactoylglutathione lyase